MKKIFSYALMLIATAVAFTSCQDDRDSNPTLVTPTSFVVNNPAVGSAVVDLLKSESVNLTWSQPEFTTMNAPVIAQYEVQVSPTGTFNKQFDESAEDNTGADYYALDEKFTTCSADIPTEAFDKALLKVQVWDDPAKVPLMQDAHVRIRAYVRDAGMHEKSSVVSNVVKFIVAPYYIELKDAPIVMWYLVGNMFGGKWGSEIGVTALPMFMNSEPTYSYDKKTGTGEITYENYFITGPYKDNGESDEAGFKIQPDDFNWNYGMTGDNSKYNTIIYRDNGDDGGHIVAGENGYYKIVMNTAKKTATMEKLDITPTNYGAMCLSGDFNGWTDTEMLPYNKEGVENHAWYYVFTITQEEIDATGKATAEFKFKTPGGWDNNWGYGMENGEVNYRGVGKGGGNNLGLPAGKYCISFNDITAEFSIVVL